MDSNQQFVNIKDIDNSIFIELIYRTPNNFTGKVIYQFHQAILRKSTALKLSKANSILKENGFRLKVLDAYRPLFAQEILWKTYPNPDFVAKPDPLNIRGHQLGATVDVTLCTLEGVDIEMQSHFDDFSEKASVYYSKRTPTQDYHFQLLSSVMLQVGFVGYDKEWWHYSDSNQNFTPIQVNPSEY